MAFDWTVFWMVALFGCAIAWDWRIKHRVINWLAVRLERWLT